MNILARIFNDGKWGVGGRFYYGWWQEIPKRFRKYITIDEGFTTELDYSALHPHMVYYKNDLEMGTIDPYTLILLVGKIELYLTHKQDECIRVYSSHL